MRKLIILLLAFSLPGIAMATARPKTQVKVKKGTLRGVVLQGDGLPMAGGKLAVFRRGEGIPPRPSRYFRVPDDVFNLDAKGRFTIHLPAGSYYVSANSIKNKDLLGPPVKGEFVFPDSTEFEKGQSMVVVRPGRQTDIGIVKAVPYRGSQPLATQLRARVTAITGRISYADGKPVPGAIALAFPSQRVLGKPLFCSGKTGRDGSYLLRVAKAGTYYIKFRTSLSGGHPKTGEIIGIYGGDKPKPVILKAGQVLRGIDMRGRKFENFQEALRKNKAKRGF